MNKPGPRRSRRRFQRGDEMEAELEGESKRRDGDAAAGSKPPSQPHSVWSFGYPRVCYPGGMASALSVMIHVECLWG